MDEVINWSGSQIICGVCGEKFAVTKEFREEKIKDHSEYFCPRGHVMRYSRRKSERENNADS
jgi:hypothetical protein